MLDREVELHALVRPASVAMPLLLRHIEYFRLATYAVFSRRRYDALFIWQQYVGIYYYLISIIFPFYNRPCCVYYFIYRAEKGSIVSHVKGYLLARMANSKFVQKAIILSRCDALYSKINAEKRMQFSTYTEKSSYIENRIRQNIKVYGSDYFSGGWSNRDYFAVKRLAEMMGDKKFSVACLPKDKIQISPIPGNMQVYCDAFGETFEDLILSSKAVILPIEDLNVTSGQIVCLRALQSAKPVFMTRNNFIADWMPDIESVRFLVMYDRLEELHAILSSLTDEDLRELGVQAREYYLSHFDEYPFYRGIADVIESGLLF